MTLTVGSCFAGIGGFDVGLERAGMTVKWQIEIDQFCRSVLAKHWPDVRRHDDIKSACGAGLEHVDLICGGVPCQPWSVAGRRKGNDDPRDLWPDFWRLCLHLRPRFILVEEVPGFAVQGGLGRALSDLAAARYDAEWFHLSACSIGAPHTRKRLFLVAYTNQSRLEERKVQQGNDGAELAPIVGGGWWAVEPDLGRVAHRVPARVDRLRSLGNAVVPQVAEVIGRRIMESLQ